jgi:5-methylthioadenosine/S-adenosylhomocysteine deaminase
MSTLTRRGMFGKFAALCAATVAASPLLAQSAQEKPSPAPVNPSVRGEYLIRNAYVMTMDSSLGDIPGGDVHLRNGEIVAVGKGLNAPGAMPLDGRGMIALPGLVETHWHMWNTFLRSFVGDEPKYSYFPMVLALGPQMTPEDIYHGTRLGAAEAINAGMTTVNNWAHNLRTPAFAEAELRALHEANIRARFSYGWYQGIAPTETVNLSDIERLNKNWRTYSNDGLIHLGLGWRGLDLFAEIPESVYRKEFETARGLGIPISVHLSGGRMVPPRAGVAVVGKSGFLGRDVLVAHCTYVTTEDIRILAAAGSPASLCPITDANSGGGISSSSDLVAAGINVCLSVDTTAYSGSCSLFDNMKFLVCTENGMSETPNKLLPRKVLEFATINGARALGIDDKVGSLTPNKRADLVLVSTRALNIGVLSDPAHLLVESTQEANVETVFLDGRMLKHNGKLTGVSADQIIVEASASFKAISKRANWRL